MAAPHKTGNCQVPPGVLPLRIPVAIDMGRHVSFARLDPLMTWRVRYFSPALHHDMQSPDYATEAEALSASWEIAQGGGEISAIEGPDGEIAGTDEIEVWFREHNLVMPPVRPR